MVYRICPLLMANLGKIRLPIPKHWLEWGIPMYPCFFQIPKCSTSQLRPCGVAGCRAHKLSMRSVSSCELCACSARSLDQEISKATVVAQPNSYQQRWFIARLTMVYGCWWMLMDVSRCWWMFMVDTRNYMGFTKLMGRSYQDSGGSGYIQSQLLSLACHVGQIQSQWQWWNPFGCRS